MAPECLALAANRLKAFFYLSSSTSADKSTCHYHLLSIVRQSKGVGTSQVVVAVPACSTYLTSLNPGTGDRWVPSITSTSTSSPQPLRPGISDRRWVHGCQKAKKEQQRQAWH